MDGHPLRFLWISRDLWRSINQVIPVGLMGLKVYDRLREDIEIYALCCEKCCEITCACCEKKVVL